MYLTAVVFILPPWLTEFIILFYLIPLREIGERGGAFIESFGETDRILILDNILKGRV